jgi:tripeptide aminopeptidase
MYIEKDVIKELFLNLVKIDSPSGHEKIVRDFIVKKIKNLNMDCKVDEYGNVIAHVSGKGKSLMISAHMDTVDPGRNISAVVNGDVITSGSNTILGADDKAGITEILCAVEYLKKNKIPHRPLELVFTCEEEAGLNGARKIKQQDINAKEGIVVDRSGSPQAVVLASPFISIIDIEVCGKSAHAGNPEKGINAIKIASDAIHLLKVGRIDSETTNNFGTISGGEIRNGVPEKVSIQAEVRSHVLKKAQNQISTIKNSFEKTVAKHGGQLKFSVKDGCSGYKHLKTDVFIKKIESVWKQMGKVPIFEKAGGASDANEFAKWGMKIVDIGYGGINPHTTREQIKISDMQLVTEFIINFIQEK